MPRRTWTRSTVESALRSKILPPLYAVVERPDELSTFVETLRSELAATAAAIHIEQVAGTRAGRVPVLVAVGIEAAERYSKYYAPRNIWLPRAWPLMSTGQVITGEMVCDRRELFASEYYNDFLRPLGIGTAASFTAVEQGTQRAVLTVFGSDKDEEFQGAEIKLLKKLSSAMTEVLTIHGKLSEARELGSSLMAGLSLVPYGVLLLDGDRQVLFANAFAELLLRKGDVLRLRHGRLEAVGIDSQAELSKAFDDPNADKREGRFVSLSSNNTSAFSLVLHFVKHYGTLFGSRSHWIALLHSPPMAELPMDDRLAKLFGLTSAEARLASLLLDGLSLAEAAEVLAVSKNTLRVQLAAIFSKTGVRRQSDFIRVALLKISHCMR